MNQSDRAAFARMMFALGDTFNEPVSEIRAEAYFDALSDLPVDDVLAVGRRAIAECRFFPRPVELREMATASDDDAAEEAWNEMRRLVRRVGYYETPTWPDPVMARAALELYGGWKALCTSLPADGPEFLGARKAFIANYKAYVNRERRDALALPPGMAGYLES